MIKQVFNYNNLHLAMYSNRFLVKTMQMVGATRGFIAKPMNIRAIINGTIAAAVALGICYILPMTLERYVPELKTLRDNQLLLMLAAALLIIGIGISLFSTYRSVVKYLKLKLDDLY